LKKKLRELDLWEGRLAKHQEDAVKREAWEEA